MGSGKSHIGKLLAQKLNYRFLDLDDAIEKSENKSIAEIFETKGEIEFRKLEALQLRKTAETTDTVIACGGGTPCFYDNMQWIIDNGFSVFLNPPIDCLLDRLSSETAQRPLLKGKSTSEISLTLEELLAKRKEYYTQADLVQIFTNETDIINNILKIIATKSQH